MAPPRPIEGTIGSRIRVILGDDGHEWLLLLDHDDGTRKWQSQIWKAIPFGLSKQINNCTAKGRYVKGVDFGPGNSWHVYGVKPDGSGAHHWWGGLDAAKSKAINEVASGPLTNKIALGSQNSCPSLCLISGSNGYSCINTSNGLFKRLKLIHSRRENVKMVRLFDDGQYYIEDDQGTEWVTSNNSNFSKELKKNKNVEETALAVNGSWIVICGNYSVTSTGVDKELSDQITDFYSKQRERKKKRDREITAYHERERAVRAAKEAAERERQEAAERAAREEQQRLVLEERKRREEEEARAKKVAEASRATALEVRLVERLTQERESIDKLETKLEEMQDHMEAMQDHFSTMQEDVYSRKRSLRESLVTLPAAQRPRWSFGDDTPQSKRREKPQCVVCQDKAPVRAVVPCGHLCLCDDCAPSISQRPSGNRLCPLCRGPAQSTLRIYS
ncbi:MAG: hypothetical protein SGBAC_003671 [Bacillariaceae sp.]